MDQSESILISQSGSDKIMLYAFNICENGALWLKYQKLKRFTTINILHGLQQKVQITHLIAFFISPILSLRCQMFWNLLNFFCMLKRKWCNSKNVQ